MGRWLSLVLLLCAALAGPVHASSGAAAPAKPAKPPVDPNFVPDEFFVTIPQLMVPLAVDTKRTRMMIIDLLVSTKKPEYRDYLTRVLPRIIDAVHVGLQSGSYAAYDSPDGMKLIKEHTLAQVRKAAGDQIVTDVLITNYRFF